MEFAELASLAIPERPTQFVLTGIGRVQAVREAIEFEHGRLGQAAASQALEPLRREVLNLLSLAVLAGVPMNMTHEHFCVAVVAQTNAVLTAVAAEDFDAASVCQEILGKTLARAERQAWFGCNDLPRPFPAVLLLGFMPELFCSKAHGTPRATPGAWLTTGSMVPPSRGRGPRPASNWPGAINKCGPPLPDSTSLTPPEDYLWPPLPYIVQSLLCTA